MKLTREQTRELLRLASLVGTDAKNPDITLSAFVEYLLAESYDKGVENEKEALKKYHRKATRKLRKRRIEEGLCYFCDEKRVNKSHCEYHRKYYNKLQNKRNIKKN